MHCSKHLCVFQYQKVSLTKWMRQFEQIIEHLYEAKSDEIDHDKTAIGLGITFNEIWLKIAHSL